MANRLVVRTFTVLEILPPDKFVDVKVEKVRTAELANHIADKLIDRSPTFRIEHTTVVAKESNDGDA